MWYKNSATSNKLKGQGAFAACAFPVTEQTSHASHHTPRFTRLASHASHHTPRIIYLWALVIDTFLPESWAEPFQSWISTPTSWTTSAGSKNPGHLVGSKKKEPLMVQSTLANSQNSADRCMSLPVRACVSEIHNWFRLMPIWLARLYMYPRGSMLWQQLPWKVWENTSEHPPPWQCPMLL